ncbi:hypothetical protein L7F22_066935 [Adiantum nelumboides]|nr:hypothetical protein [Adiantum nelumboides]
MIEAIMEAIDPVVDNIKQEAQLETYPFFALSSYADVSALPKKMTSFSASPSAALEASSGVKSHGTRVQTPLRLEKRERVQASLVVKSALTTCNIASAARCSAEQQTVQNPVVTKSPTQARQKENLPKLDDGGPGGGPGRGDGGGGGGGGGGGWAGGFALWGFLLLLSFIKEKEKDKPFKREALTKSKLKKMREAYL